MKLWQIGCICLVMLMAASQTASLNYVLNQTLAGGPAGSTVVGPVFTGADSKGIASILDSNFTYWKRDAAGIYQNFSSGTPHPGATYISLAQEYVPGNKIAAQMSNSGSSNIFNSVPAESVLTYPSSTPFTINAIAFNTNGSKFFTANSDGSIHVWGRDTNTNAYTPRERLLNHSSSVIDINAGYLFQVVSLGSNGEVIVWFYNAVTDKFEFYDYAVVPGGTKVAGCGKYEVLFLVGKNDGSIESFYWTAFDGYQSIGSPILGNKTGHTSAIQSLELSPGCIHLYSAADTLIHWTTDRPPVFGTFTAADVFPNFNPHTVHTSMKEFVVSEEGTGKFRVYDFSINCSSINQTNIDPYTCDCPVGHFWDGEICYDVDCFAFPYATNNSSPTSCNCIPGFYWDSNVVSCVVNCSNITHTTGAFDIFICNCATGYDWFNNSCVWRVPCANDPLSTGLNFNTITCRCIASSDVHWNNVTQLCTVNCSTVDYTTPTINATVNATINNSTCSCIKDFVWTVGAAACYPNCSAVQFSTGVKSVGGVVDKTACTCLPPSTWVGYGCGIDCATVDNAVQLPSVNMTCTCYVGYYWNAVDLSCWRNCSEVANTVNGTNENRTTCNCAHGFEWSGTNCVLSVIDCATVQNATGNNQTTNCNCVATFYYYPATCSINCLNYEFSNGTSVTATSCACQAGFFWDATNNICNVDCTKVLNSTGAAANASRVCGCVAGFNWSPVNYDCVRNCSAISHAFALTYSVTACGCDAGWFWTGDVCVINCALIKWALVNSNSSACTCSAGFVWEQNQCVVDCSVVAHADTVAVITWGVYSCPCVSGYYWNAGYCQPNFSCASINFAAGVNPATNNTCLCQSGYFWQFGACWLDCSGFPGVSNGANNGLAACTCLSGRVWNGFGCFLLPICSGMVGSQNIPSPFNPSVCLCLNNFFWNGTSCVIGCPSILNSNGVALSQSSCGCNAGYSWNVNSFTCAWDCSTIAFTNVAASQTLAAGTCVCSTGYFWSSGKCYLDCSLKRNATQTSSLTSCSCLNGYFWNATAANCFPDCPAMGGLPSNTNVAACDCQTGYFWENGYCWLDCSVVLYSNGSNNGVAACDCQTGYYWDWTLGACAFNCSAVANSNNTNADPNPYTCSCNNNFYWNTTVNRCFLNCSLITNTSSTTGETSCFCATYSVWNSNTFSCVYTPPAGSGSNSTAPAVVVNCSALNHTNGTSAADVCFCVDGYKWNSTAAGCWLDCTQYPNVNGNTDSENCKANAGFIWNGKVSIAYRDCSQVANATTYDPNNITNCLCKQGWTYNPSTNQCVFDCKNINYTSSSTPNSNGSCQCASGYYWDSIIYQCVSKSSSNKLAIGLGVGLGVPFGLLALGGLGLLIWALMTPAAAAIPMGMVPVAAPMAIPTATALVTSKMIPTATTIAMPSRAVIGAPVQQVIRSPGLVSNVRVGSPLSGVQSNFARGISPINVGPSMAGPQMINPQVLQQPGMTFGGQNVVRGPGIQSVVRRI